MNLIDYAPYWFFGIVIGMCILSAMRACVPSPLPVDGCRERTFALSELGSGNECEPGQSIEQLGNTASGASLFVCRCPPASALSARTE